MNSTYAFAFIIFAAVFAFGVYCVHRAAQEKQAKT